jgi:tetratricopeptide (TPR) repeat protein
MLSEAVGALEHAYKIDFDFADKDVRGNRDLARTLTNLGIAYRWQGHTDKAIDTLTAAVSYIKKLTDKDGHFKSDLAIYVNVIALYNLSASYQQSGRTDEALKHLNEALDLIRDIAEKGGPFRLSLIDILILLGRIYIFRGGADDLKNARKQVIKTRELLKKEKAQQQMMAFITPEYASLVRGLKDLHSLTAAWEKSKA